jgi:UDP-2,3-diacylglucosamine hydrolase
MVEGAPAMLRVPQPAAEAADWPVTAQVSSLMAAPDWQTIDLVSDLHLDPAHPRTARAFFDYVTRTTADAVLILGDLFEAWVGDDMRHQAFEAQCVEALRQASERRWLGIMVGNRDFLMGAALMSASGAHALPDPFVLTAFGQRHLITHGDAWCLDDAPYLAFRKQVRQSNWQRAFLAQGLDARLATARQMRQASEARKAESTAPETWADVDPARAVAWLHAAEASQLIHGHTHRPGRSRLDDARLGLPSPLFREVLSDWDLDDTRAPRAEVLRLNARGVHRLQPATATATKGE